MPPKIVDIDRWAFENGRDANVVEALKGNGVAQYFDADGEPVESMLAKAVAALKEESGFDPADIGAIVYVHTMQVSTAPPPQSVFGPLLKRFAFDNALCFSIAQQNCVSFLASLRILRTLFLQRSSLRKALIVGSDVLPFPSQRPIEDNGIHSDGAAAALVVRNGTRNRMLSVSTRMDGRFFRGVLNDEEYTHNDRYYWSMLQVMRTAMKDSGTTPEHIRRVLPHNLNIKGWHKVLGALGIETDRLFADNITDKGHVFACDGMINLADGGATIASGERFMIHSNGFSGCFGCGVFER
ncbi:MAG: hypothetical protein KJ947_11135 [Alphaproteobacteria bacterium]|nr:hypothetical protein [Alphaproteobacteria bacterium]MBU1550110.1 hypothetical protein [Alphaproteobacteria bacterium]MBU2337088.1 hypothetical protein [Alphaproteobacteria bacterium]MBU2389419.1 hypothetical protein [Alphaproteobacteria bacterium]